MGTLLRVDLSSARLRICHCVDHVGFWLAPHTDLSMKLATLVLYVHQEPDAFDVATDLFDVRLRRQAPIGVGVGDGLLFAPGADTYHGFALRPKMTYRTTLVINYVADTWVNVGELV